MLSPPLILRPIGLRLADIGRLRRLITTTEHHERGDTTLGIVHTVSRPVVHPELPDTLANDMDIPEIPKPDPCQPGPDARPGLRVTQSPKPCFKGHTPGSCLIHLNGIGLRL